ncbi:hypothetical protein, partial [Ruegeria sp. SCP11]|uniref:hypothetical protein n=1 Tax=Ruegeria sp. SCP11 TaxID=3141378 RepID=UPI00333B3142
NSSSFVERTISDVSLSNGDVIEIAGFQDSGEPLRTDYLDFQPTDAATDVTVPVVSSAGSQNIGAAQVGNPDTQITVTFADNIAVDASSIDSGDITVSGPAGPLAVT